MDARERIRTTAARVDPTNLLNLLRRFVDLLEGEVRMQFVQAFLNAHVTKEVTIFYHPLYWPPDKIEQFRIRKDKWSVRRERILAHGDKIISEKPAKLARAVKKGRVRFVLVTYDEKARARLSLGGKKCGTR